MYEYAKNNYKIDKNTFSDLQIDTKVKRGIAMETYTFVRILKLNYNLEH